LCGRTAADRQTDRHTDARDHNTFCVVYDSRKCNYTILCIPLLICFVTLLLPLNLNHLYLQILLSPQPTCHLRTANFIDVNTRWYLLFCYLTYSSASHRNRATLYISLNLDNCCTTVRKIAFPLGRSS